MVSARARFFEDNGYLVVPDVLDADGVAALRHEEADICRGERGAVDGLEPLDDADDDAVMRQYLCIHFPHKISTLMRDALAEPGIVDVLGELIGPNVKCMQSMLFVKHAGKPGQAWHQDEYFIPTRDRSLAAAWIALDDATRENGALWVIPGSHRNGVLWPMGPHDRDDEFDPGHEAHDFPFEESQAVSCEVPAGGVVFFSGYLLHRSFRNRSTGFRRALVNHYMSAESLLPWDWDGRLAATRDNRDIVLVRGEDPYAYKGTEDLTFPFLRPETPAQRHAAQKVF
ncbi:MAG: phytanoyl-CoA dioxygenase family protein [Actinomycetota bacterium]|nr:phytanoyl-CoA dioxygenase family protein [Actinomycetota bacterium]